MPISPAARRRRTFCPEFHALEGRALMAIGQITLAFPTPSVGGARGTTVTGNLAGGLIEIQAFDVGAFTPISIGTATGGAGVGKVSFAPVSIQTVVGRHTPNLFLVMASGGHFTSAQIVVRDEAARVRVTYNLGTVFISSHQVSASQDGEVTESDTLNFGSLQVTINDPLSNKVIQTTQWNQITNTSTVSTLGFPSSSVSTAAISRPPAGGGTGTVTPDGLIPTNVKLTAAKVGNGTRLTAKVTSTSGTPTGSVAFYNGKTALGLAQVGADGNATITLPGKLGGSKLVALYSGGTNSRFATGSSVTANKSATTRLFQRLFNRPMNADEWMLTSLWLQQGLTLAKLKATYQRLAAQN